MALRPFQPRDLDRLVELTVETFGPFYEESFRPVVGDTVFAHQHGGWRVDYTELVPSLHDPDNNKYVAVAEIQSHIVGYIAWNVDAQRRHGAIELLAVAPAHRGRRLGTALCEHAFADMTARNVEIGTGGDPFHAPARALYESLSCTLFPTAVFFKQL